MKTDILTIENERIVCKTNRFLPNIFAASRLAQIALMTVILVVLCSFIDAGAKQHPAIAVDFDGSIVQSSGSIHPDDSLALVALYNSAGGPDWTPVMQGWLVDRVDFWTGVTQVENVGTDTDPEWRVTRLEFPRNIMTTLGELPPELGAMAYLDRLVFRTQGNFLTGEIPEEVEGMQRLSRFDVQQNRMIGNIPWDTFSRMPRLARITVNDNQLTGQIPESIAQMQNLTHLELHANLISGTVPQGVAQLENLLFLRLRGNLFTGSLPNLSGLQKLERLETADNDWIPGPLPEWIRDLAGTLEELRVQNSNLTGELPAWLPELIRLRVLYVGNDDIGGEIPDLSFMVNLEDIQLLDAKFSGPLPDWLGFLPNLMRLQIVNNAFTGPIPASFANNPFDILRIDGTLVEGELPASFQNISTLRRLQIANNPNLFIGEIPPWIINLGSLQRLELTGSGVAGTLPDFLGNMPILTELLLSNNVIRGTIPASLGNATNLEELVLSGNLLTGTLPASLQNLTRLRIFSTSGNNLGIGELPAWIGNLQFLQSLNLSGSGVTGSIPDWMGSMSRLQSLNLSSNQLTGSIPESLGNLGDNDIFIFTSLNLSSNQLTGEIPSSFSKFHRVTTMQLSRNNFDPGPIPAFLSSLDSLSFLGLSTTNRTGEIPDWIGSYPNLSVLVLNDNQLTGQIPAGLSAARTIDSLNLADNLLSGNIPAGLQGLGMGDQTTPSTTMQTLILSGNENLQGPVPMFFTEWDTDVMRVFWFNDTRLCEPVDAAFHAWIDGILEPGPDATETTFLSVQSSGISCADVTDVETESDIPKTLHLYANYPNPFNPVTTIRFDVPDDMHVKLGVYNVLGQLVTTLVNEQKTPGRYEVHFDAASISSGTYIYRLESGSGNLTRTMMLVK